jgi:quercetin dioxygenase-like cupin family protein
VETTQAQVIDLAALAASAATGAQVGAVWSLVSHDLNLNLLRFATGDGVEPHTNTEVDIIGLVISGKGILDLDGRQEHLQPGSIFFVPKGARRSIQSHSNDFAYLSCHRRRAGLMPTRAPARSQT